VKNEYTVHYSRQGLFDKGVAQVQAAAIAEVGAVRRVAVRIMARYQT